MYQDGPQLLLYNNKVFAQWLVYAIMQSAALFFFCAMVSGTAIEIFPSVPFMGDLESGKIADSGEIMSALIFLTVCLTVNNRLLSVDTSGLTLEFLATVLTSMSIAFAFIYLNSYKQDRPEMFTTIWKSPQVLLCLVGFVLASAALE